VSVTNQISEVSPAVQHRANPSAGGRHRATALHSHRAPGTPFGERGRYAILTAALVAGAGVAGVTAVTTGAAPASSTARAALETQARAQTPVSSQQSPLTAPPVVEAETLPAFVPNPAPSGTPEPSPAPLGFARAQQKERPKPPPPVATAARWVHPMPEARVTSCFGQRWGRLHAGVDLAAPHGTPIRAAGGGTVALAGVEGGYGNAVLIDHGNGYLTHYGHMSAITVTIGQQVAPGEQIGNEGSTGHSTGPHLHFEVHKGTYKNPIEPTGWMHEHGVDIGGCGPLTDR
jgi:murein DD-endopeptidase MepM/ murein hydrolase activator NlpD